MPKSRADTLYRCSDCGAKSHKWVGQCGSCGAWNTLSLATDPGVFPADLPGSKPPTRLSDVFTTEYERYQTGLTELAGLIICWIGKEVSPLN